jgi:hypothetical protein
MTAIVWINLVLTIPFLVAFIGVPLWMTFRTPQIGPDHAQAHAYLRAKTFSAVEFAGLRGDMAANDHARDGARQPAAA